MKRLKDFLDAVGNEISADKSFLHRLGETDLGYTPIRPAKSLDTIKKLNISRSKYLFIAIVFVLVSPIFFLAKMFFNIVAGVGGRGNKNSGHIHNLVLIANGRVVQLLPKVGVVDACLLNINQKKNDKYIGLSCYAGVFDYLGAYFDSLFSVIYGMIKLDDRADVLQLYVAYEWFFTYRVLESISPLVDNIFFANHYDRWAVLFDKVFANRNITLIQHGLLSDQVSVSYKLSNINYIYIFDSYSKQLFSKFVDAEEVEFHYLSSTISLDEVAVDRFTLLFIGQPHSAQKEVEIANRISMSNMDMHVMIKPHPLYGTSIYKGAIGADILSNKDFFPRVDLALCYESTLGLEYESSGVKVLWWKGMNSDDVMKYVKTEFANFQVATNRQPSIRFGE